jgi:hypothetical protein
MNTIVYTKKFRRKHINFYFFFLLYFFNKKLLTKSIYSRSYMESVLKRFFFLILSLDWMFGLFMYIDEVLVFILNILNLNNFFKIILNFYAISNIVLMLNFYLDILLENLHKLWFLWIN